MRLTWFGHSAFRLDIDDAHILIDPFLTGNPSFKGDVAKASEGVTHIILTHGHADHVGDTVEIARKTGAQVISVYEVCQFIGSKGIDNIGPLNHGGGADFGPIHVTLTKAFHSSTDFIDGQFLALGNPAGVVIRPANGDRIVYHMGDTDIFGDMALVAELYDPKIVMVPIGDRFTMGPRTAAMSINRYFPHADYIVPCHYGTFPPLTGTVPAFSQELGVSATKLLEFTSGQSIDI